MDRALEEQILIDPDLIEQNLASSAIDVAPPDGTLPSPETGPRALADARAAALSEIGGQDRMLRAPAPASGGEPGAGKVAVSRQCFGRVEYSIQWAARMPPALPVYPHAAVQEAAGADAPGCALRVVSFLTPVPPAEVIDYYFTRVSHAGLPAARFTDAGDDVLSGTRGGAAYAVRVREQRPGLTEVDLVTSGL